MILVFVGIWLLASVVTAALACVTFFRYDDEIEGCPNPDLCPGCDGHLEFDDEGSNICSLCGLTWWRR